MYSTYTKLGYLPWAFSPVSPGQQKKEGSPLLALYAAELLMLSLMAVDGRRQPLALGLGARRSFNKSKSAQCHYINILGQLPWRSGGAGGLPDEAVSVQENHLRWINAAGWTQWRVPAHLDTCRPRNRGLDGRCFPNCSQAAVFCSYTHSQCRNLRPLFVQLQKMKTLGNVETIPGQDYDLWFLLCRGEEKKKSNNKIRPLARHKDLFPKVSIQ